VPARVRPDGEGGGFEVTEGHRLMAALPDGTRIGDVSWHSVKYGPNARSGAYNFGIGLQPEYRGKGYGTRVQRLLAQHLFATTDVFRVEASTDVDNLAEQRALTKAGFTREGVLRGAQFRADMFRDLVLFSRLRTDQP
jgi:RimJ/RimL family protein N-acetyltransferase